MLEVLSHHGKFLGMWNPAEDCNCMCGRRIDLRQALKLLALVQILGAAPKIYSQVVAPGSPQVSQEVLSIALALWVMKGVRRKQQIPILNFAFSCFLLAAGYFIQMCVGTLYYAFKGELLMILVILALGAYLTFYQVYYAYIAWSFAYALAHGDPAAAFEEGEGMTKKQQDKEALLDNAYSPPVLLEIERPGETEQPNHNSTGV